MGVFVKALLPHSGQIATQSLGLKTSLLGYTRFTQPQAWQRTL
ncbi:hypothetical protein [Marinospirillum sp.]|nr:hypothetical protein [Marinospirillum sp.]